MKIQPYRIFFPVGIAYALWGVGLWIYFIFKHGDYPGSLHADIMIAGFMSAMVTGFLMTAVPRITQTEPMRLSEISLFLCWDTAWVFSILFVPPPHGMAFGHMFFALKILLLGGITASRFFRGIGFPASFFLVPAGLLAGAVGALIQAWGEWTYHFSALTVVGRNLFIQGMMLSLILGVGGHIVPRFLGGPPPKLLSHPARRWALIILLLGSYFIEGWWLPWGRGLRAAVATAIVTLDWKWPRIYRGTGPIGYGLWFSMCFLLCGLWGAVLFPDFSLHLSHFTFVGGFGLMAIMVASRVTLAHGGYGVMQERTPLLWIVTSLLSIAAIVRALAWIKTQSYENHLAYAAAFLILGLCLWIWFYFPRLFRTRSAH
jgi:uncharacterized protein involved in response to NO